ncbi:MAG TPA: hypothetical protein ENN87_12290 [Phycisphaerales bacterium]|nr:hypothetical protein [Phycisphaerales bacterium]
MHARHLVGVVVLWTFLSAGAAHGGEGGITQMIQDAGNVDRDDVRLGILKDLRQRPGIGEALGRDLDTMIRQIERWLGDPRLDYFGGQAQRDMDFDFGIAEDSPVMPLTWPYRGEW